MKRVILLFSIITPALILGHGAYGAENAEHSRLIEDRIERFKTNKTAMRVITQSFMDNDFRAIENAAQTIEDWAMEMASYFPLNSKGSPSQANDAIWQNPDRFQLLIKENVTAARQLKDLSIAENSADLPAAIRRLSHTCKACHDQFRN